ncbi:uncharacterized protein [Malus domestica]|uniref:uncharacterized protein n=1 Tax=Malus domestica TaxID=3750 RepID=UPI003974D298
MIASTIKVQNEGNSHDSVLYSKPYSKKIDALKMPRGYQPPKFVQFDGKGNPKQNVAHFIETCNNVGTEGDYLNKQFVHSLKGNAFDWYTDLEPESINSWDQLEMEFFNCFCRTVSMLKLTSIKPRTFEELATRSHDMKLSIANHRKKELITDFKKDKVFFPNVDKTRKKPSKEAFTINTAPIKTSFVPIKISSKTKAKEIKRGEPPRTQDKYKSTLMELTHKAYPFPNSDMDTMLDDLLKKKVIELPECKRPEEMNHVNNPRYCKYHRIVSHPVGKCFVIKELIMKLAQQGQIELDLEDTAVTHTTTITFRSFDLVPLQATLDHSRQCSSCTAHYAQTSPGASDQDAHTDDKKG